MDAVTKPISPGERGIVMLKVESNRGIAALQVDLAWGRA